MQIITIPLKRLIPDTSQPRQAMSEEELTALASSIRERGLLLPLRVQPADVEGNHRLVSGHRRHSALLHLGMTEAPCVLVNGPLDESAILGEQLMENILREDLSAIEEADGYSRYIELKGITAVQAAAELHVPPARISRALALLTLPEQIRVAVQTKRIAKETAYYLSRLPDGDDRDNLFARALAGTLTRETAIRAAKKSHPKESETAPAISRVTCKLQNGRSLTLLGPAIKLEGLIETLEDVLKEARKARAQGWDVSTLARVFRDRATPGERP